MSKQFDNSNSGALFTNGVADVLSGPWQYEKKQDGKHMLVMQLGKPGEAHALRIHARKKDGSPGKLVESGTVRAVTPVAGKNLPVARGTIGDLRVCLWKQENGNRPGEYFYQVKPDAFEARELPAL